MSYYRENFPQATILPKMHLMEDHIVSWVKKYRVGFGLMGEQGAESIHAEVNSIKASYRTIPDREKRLHHIMQEHHRRLCPVLIQQQPPIKKRKLLRKDI